MGNYNTDSIQELDFFSAVRKYPGMYIGSIDSDGLHHLAKEIISNSIDEYLNSTECTNIVVCLREDGSLSIKDNGRGIPIGKKDDGTTALELCFKKEHAGGKFLNATGESGYNSAGGMHGLGGKCVNALSDWMNVTSMRDGKIEKIEFCDGLTMRDTIHDLDENMKDYHGTQVHFKPSSKYLETTEFEPERLKKLIKEFSFLSKGLTFYFVDLIHNTKEKYISENGLYDYLEYLADKKEPICSPFYFEEFEGTFQTEVAFTYTSAYGSEIKLYTNNIPQIKGTHLTGFKTALTSALNSFAREKKWLKDKDANLTGSDYEEGLLLVINFKMIDPVFKGQNKEELSSSEGRTYMQKFTSKALRELFENNEKDIKLIFDKAAGARKAREAAKKAREKAREGNKKKEKALKFSSKLADCNSKDRSKCEIYVTEGDSASGNLKSARNNEFQAVMPVRGKILNVQKATLDKIQKNAEIMTMIEAFGLKVDMKTMKLTYDEDDLRYDKIIIASDADVDGAHIKNLFYTFIWNFCPKLIEEGHIYALVPPLYRIIIGKDENIYLKDDAALEAFRQTYKGKKCEIKRFKGLGEMGADETLTLTNPNERILCQVTVEDIEKTDKLFDDLMGTNVTPRKNFIKEHSAEATYE